MCAVVTVTLSVSTRTLGIWAPRRWQSRKTKPQGTLLFPPPWHYLFFREHRLPVLKIKKNIFWAISIKWLKVSVYFCCKIRLVSFSKTFKWLSKKQTKDKFPQEINRLRKFLAWIFSSSFWMVRLQLPINKLLCGPAAPLTLPCTTLHSLYSL